MRLFRFTALLALAGCVVPPPPTESALDLHGTWSTTPDFGAPGGYVAPYAQLRLVLGDGAVLNPLGPDCQGQPRFAAEPALPFFDLLSQRQWPLSWSWSLMTGVTLVQPVRVSCGARTLFELVPLTTATALLPLPDGTALVLYRSTLRPG